MIALNLDPIDRFIAEDDGQPIVMLNLVRFNSVNDASFTNIILAWRVRAWKGFGAEVIFAGDGLHPLAATAGEEWDAVALVRYPSLRAFAELVADPEYQRADPVRVSALAAAVLQPLRVMAGTGN